MEENKQPRIALCLSGQPRGIPLGLKYIRENLIEPNGQMDVFMHAWFDPDKVGEPWDTAQPPQASIVGRVKEKSDEILVNYFKPKDYIIEPQREFEWARELQGDPTAKQESLVSLFYSMYTANELKRQYEKENNFKYDIVIRTRYDLWWGRPYHLSDPGDSIVTSLRFQLGRVNTYTLTDIFAYGNSENMDVFSSVYPNYVEYHKILRPPYGENFLGHHVRIVNNIPIAMHEIDIEILQRVVDYNNTII